MMNNIYKILNWLKGIDWYAVGLIFFAFVLFVILCFAIISNIESSKQEDARKKTRFYECAEMALNFKWCYETIIEEK